jgi:hypothetical protein
VNFFFFFFNQDCKKHKATLFLNRFKEMIKVFSYILLLAQQEQAAGPGAKA